MSEAIWTISIGEELSGYILGTKIVDGFIFITSQQLIEVTKDLPGENNPLYCILVQCKTFCKPRVK